MCSATQCDGSTPERPESSMQSSRPRAYVQSTYICTICTPYCTRVVVLTSGLSDYRLQVRTGLCTVGDSCDVRHPLESLEAKTNRSAGALPTSQGGSTAPITDDVLCMYSVQLVTCPYRVQYPVLPSPKFLHVILTLG